MKKILLFVLVIFSALTIVSCCSKDLYKLTLDYPHEIENELDDKYPAGAEVTIKLSTVTEHYYTFYLNGEKQNSGISSDLEYTTFTFIMPDEDTVVKIEENWVDIPDAP